MEEGNHPRRPSSGRFTPFELDCLLQLENETVPNTSSAIAGTAGNSTYSEESLPLELSGPAGVGESPTNSGQTQHALWDAFESCAYSVAKLYRSPNWNAFQLAAASATQLYKDSIEANRRGVEQGMNIGRQKLVKELLGYLCCSKRSNPFVRREDLLGILAGRTPPARQQTGGMNSPLLRTLDQLRLQSSPTHHRQECRDGCSPALFMFHEALAPTTDPSSSPVGGSGGGVARGSPPRRPYPRQELSSFLMDEVRRHRKRRYDSSSTPIPHSQGSNRSPVSSHNGKRRRVKVPDQ